ncbi:hypothetical protein [Streptomyces sp. NBC_01198]|uniref:hypothetical protein n=1 Tax=Streptomyces sp. NBC_01198 TaxID=2903769 RepID=UPI002E164CD4|nr:hypothetical protein OG702_28565 [Streptomyces sp. NBC_01198]
MVPTGTYQSLFAAVAASAAGLTGLLFVAMSVAPRSGTPDRPVVIQQVRAAASLSAFTNALAVSLLGLVPGNNVGYPAIVLAVIGILFTAAGARSTLSGSGALRPHVRRQAGLVVLLLAVFGLELASGIELVVNPRSVGAAERVGNLLVVLLLIGIARAWELIGDRETGMFASIAVLAGREGKRSAGPEG